MWRAAFKPLPLAFFKCEGMQPWHGGVSDSVARGVICRSGRQDSVPWQSLNPHKSASLVMTDPGQTFQKYFRWRVSEDLLVYTERIIVDKLVLARLRNTTELHLIISRTERFARDRQRNNLMCTVCLNS